MAEDIPFDPFDLTPLDHIIPPCYVRFFLSFPVSDVPTAIAQLQAGMAILSSQVPFLEGDLVPCDRPGARKGLLEIRPRKPNTTGSEVLVVKYHKISLQKSQTAASNVEQLGTTDESYLPLPFFPDIGKPVPIFRLQINALTDGVILGFVFHHNVFDATGFGLVVQELARCCQSPNDIIQSSLLPNQNQHQAVRERILKHQAPSEERQDHSTEFPVVTSLSEDLDGIKAMLMQTASLMSTRYFHLPAYKVDHLKRICNKILPMLPNIQQRSDGETPWVSSNDIVVSLLWMCLNRSRYSFHENCPLKRSEICMAVNARGRMNPPILSNYIGNMIVLLRESIDMNVFLQTQHEMGGSKESAHSEPSEDSEVPSCPEIEPWQIALCRIATTIRKKLNSVDDSYLRSVISYLENVPDLSTVGFSQSDFHMSSWRDTGVYEADFGGELRHPSDMRVPDGMVDGQFYILPKRLQKDALWEIHVTIHQDTMKRLCSDELWASYTAE